jgi:4-amino-4-deoxy-L-arabinose transferase-like glycosyltransferase
MPTQEDSKRKNIERSNASHAPGERGRTPEKHHSKMALALFAVLLASTFALALIYSGGPSYMGDDVAYAFFAHRAMLGQFAQASGDILSIRIMQIYPIAFFYALLGVNSISSQMWDVLAFLGTIAVTFFIGSELYNDYAGLIGAFLLALSPIAGVIATTMSDNVPLMFFASLGMLGILYGERSRSGKWYFVSGASFVAASLVMPEGMIAFAVAVLYLVVQAARKKTKLRPLAGFAVGLAVTLLLTVAFNYLNAQNPLITFTSTFDFYQQANTTFAPANGYLGFYPSVMFPYNLVALLARSASAGASGPLLVWNGIAGNSSNVAGLLFYLLLPAAAYLLLRKERRVYFLLFWVVVGFLLLEFDPFHVSLFPFAYSLQHRLDRYLTLIAPAVALLISFALVKLVENKKGARKCALAAFSALVLLLVAYTSLGILSHWHYLNLYERYDQVAIAGYLGALPNTTQIYYLNGFAFTEIYMQFANASRFQVYDQVQNCSRIPAGAYVLMPKNEQVFGIPFTPNPTKYCPSWQMVYAPEMSNESSEYWSSAAPSEVVLYYVPKMGAPS